VPTPAAKPAAPPPPKPAPATIKADLGACRATLAEFSGRNTILFAAGAALIAPESQNALDELSKDLAACPEAVVHIEGYTDSDGDERANLALSVARAEAVVEALILRRISPDRLYAVGYGEANPIADNTTPAGRRLNRRIVVTIPD
jgi:outer membrane protein OmpA-like peptidoglycan-associated protein